MTTHEMILLCSSFRVGRCIPLRLVLGFATFVGFGKIGATPTYGLKHAAACQIFLGDCWCLVQRSTCWDGDCCA
jgi:hypothetical protein